MYDLLSYLYVPLQVSFCPGVVRGFAASRANPHIPVLLDQRVDHAVVRDARVHLLLQERIFRIVIF